MRRALARALCMRRALARALCASVALAVAGGAVGRATAVDAIPRSAPATVGDAVRRAPTLEMGCALSVVAVNVGPYDPLADAPTVGRGAVTLACTRPTTAAVSVGAGVSLDAGARAMRAARGDGRLRYALSLDAAGVRPWGDGSRGTTTMSFDASDGSREASRPVFVTVPPHQNLPAGTYGDTLLVTVAF